MNWKKLKNRTVVIAIVIHSIPLLAYVCIKIGVEPIALIAGLLLWGNIPFSFGLEQLFGSSHIQMNEFGITDISMTAFLYIVFFWFIVAGILSWISMLFSKKV